MLKLNWLRVVCVLGGWLLPTVTADWAARVFATPFANSRSRARLARADEAMLEGELLVNGQRVVTYTWGDPATQPYALLVHGWSSYGLRFLPWVARLRERGYAVVAFDQPAHGRSSGTLSSLPEFTDAVRELGRRHGPAALAIGHSLGGAALVLAQGETWHAERLVLFAPLVDMLAAAQRFMRLVCLREPLQKAFVAWARRRTGIDVHDLRLHRHVAALGQPCLIVHDLADTDIPWEEGERYARHWSDARLLTTCGLGHHRIVDDATVVESVLRFVDGEAVGERVVSSPNLPYGVA